jgi:cell division protease FtsH
MIFGKLTTGASNDILSATELATRLICEWGMNPTIGPVAHMQEQSGFLGGNSSVKPYSEKTAQTIDNEIKKTIETCYEATRQLLSEHNKFLHKLAEALLVNETVDAEEMAIVHHCYLKQKEIEESIKSKREGKENV